MQRLIQDRRSSMYDHMQKLRGIGLSNEYLFSRKNLSNSKYSLKASLTYFIKN